MYPVMLDFNSVLERIEKLLRGHPAEALVTSVFTFEKLMKRCVGRSIVARGFTVEQAESLLHHAGFDDLKRMWDVFERDHRRLPALLGACWQHLPEAKTMRNDLVHGNEVYELRHCRVMAKHVLQALEALHNYGKDTFGHDPWKKRPRKKAELIWSP